MLDQSEEAVPRPQQYAATGGKDFKPNAVPAATMRDLEAVAGEVGGPYVPLPATEGAVGFTHFDTPASEDNAVIVLLAKENMDRLPSQALVRIKSLKDDGAIDREYLGVVVSGPFAEPDGLRADSPIVIATTVQGRIFLPRYHGRVHVEILGEDSGGQLVPPRWRPRPNSPVFPLDLRETELVLKVGGDARLGTVVGQDQLVVRIPTSVKAVLPRHTGIIGTTGGGKSTTVSGLVNQLQEAGVATILFDVEGEYTEMDEPTTDPQMIAALNSRGLKAHGIKGLKVHHLVGRETSREVGTDKVEPFCLRFSELSPYAVMDILELSEAQRTRFYLAYETTRLVLKDLKVFPNGKDEEKQLLELDELDTGYPRMTLSHLIDIAGAILDKVAKNEDESEFFNAAFKGTPAKEMIKRRIDAAARKTDHEASWRATLSRLWSIHRLAVFDNPKAQPLDYAALLTPSRVSVIDLSDTDSPYINNLVIAGVLRGVQRDQEIAVEKARQEKRKPAPVVLIIEEAHEFLSKERIDQMRSLFQQVARIAKRGRKRWLGLVFVTQFPQHLPEEVLGLLNNWVLHKIADAGVVDRLRRSISGLDKAQWGMVPGLAQGQAMVSISSMTRPLLVSVDPTPCRLRLTE
jgi:DNA helicase HerA-like ATPase